MVLPDRIELSTSPLPRKYCISISYCSVYVSHSPALNVHRLSTFTLSFLSRPWCRQQQRLPRLLTHHRMLVPVGAFSVLPGARGDQPLGIKPTVSSHPGGVGVSQKNSATKTIRAIRLQRRDPIPFGSIGRGGFCRLHSTVAVPRPCSSSFLPELKIDWLKGERWF